MLKRIYRSYKPKKKTTTPATDAATASNESENADAENVVEVPAAEIVSATRGSGHGLLKKSQKYALAVSNLNFVATELILPVCCFHKRFEFLGSVVQDSDALWDAYLADTTNSCGHHCSFCTGESKQRAVNVAGLRSFFFDLFVSHNAATLAIPDDLSKKMSEIKGSSKKCFRSGRGNAAVTVSDAKMLVFRFLCVGILEPVYTINQKKEIVVTTKLAKRPNGRYCLEFDVYFKRFTK